MGGGAPGKPLGRREKGRGGKGGRGVTWKGVEGRG